MESEPEFRKNLEDPNKRRAAYDALVSDGYDMEAFDQFEINIGYASASTPASASQAQPQQPTQSVAEPARRPADMAAGMVAKMPVVGGRGGEVRPGDSASPMAEAAARVASAVGAPIDGRLPSDIEVGTGVPRDGFNPTETDKIRMLHGVESSMEDFRERTDKMAETGSRARGEMTAEGRTQARAAEFQARAMGLPTSKVGLAGVAKTRQEEAETTEGENPAVSSGTYGNSPRPYGVTVENGELKTRWMLPDGSLTTDVSEVGVAEQQSREERLQHEFEGNPSRYLEAAAQKQLEELEKREKQVAEKEMATAYSRREGESRWGYFLRMLGKSPNTQTGAVTRAVSGYDTSVMSGEVRDLMAERRILEQTLQGYRARRLKKGDGFFDWQNVVNFAHGVKDAVTDLDYYAMGALELQSMNQLLGIKAKLEKGEELSDHETALLQAQLGKQMMEESGTTPHGYHAGEITAEMIPFMVQMYFNPAGGIGKVAGKKAIRMFGRKLAKQTAGNALGKLGKKRAAAVVKGLGVTVGDVASSKFLADTYQASSTTADALRRHAGEVAVDENGNYSFAGGDGLLRSFAKAEGAATIENYTEMLGGHLGLLGRAVGKGVGKLAKPIRKLGGGRLLDGATTLMTHVSGSDWAKGIAAIEEKAQWSGPVGEMLEEEAGIVLNSIFVGDNKLSDLVDKEQQIDIALGVGCFGAFVSGIKTAGYPVARVRARNDLRRREVVGRARFMEDWDSIMSAIDDCEEKDLGRMVGELVGKYANSDLQAKAIAGYAAALVRSRGYNLARQAKVADPEMADRSGVEDSFEAGMELADTASMAAAREAFETQRRLMLGEASQLTDDIQGVLDAADDDPVGTLQKYKDNVELCSYLLDYVNAKATYDGMLQGVQDRVDERIAASDAQIDGRVNNVTGFIQPATMKVDDRRVFVVGGGIAVNEDGTIDHRASDASLVIRDAETGKLEVSHPKAINLAERPVDAAVAKSAAAEAIRDQGLKEASDKINGLAESSAGEPSSVEYHLNDILELKTPEGEVVTGMVNAEVNADGLIEVETSEPINGRVVNLFPPAQLAEMEAQRNVSPEIEPISVPKTEENVPNPTENEVSVAENMSETVSTVENGQQTALQLIPLHPETGEPMFEAVDKDTAWDGLVEAVGGEKDAVDIAMAQIEQASTDLEALKKKPPTLKAPKLKGSPMAMAQAKREANEAHQRAMADYQNQLAEAETRQKAWNNIMGVYTSRNAEKRAQEEAERRMRDAQAHDEAVARFEEEQRIKAEKQAEQEAIGTHAVNPKIKERWDSAPKLEGNPDAITLPDGSTIRGRYVLTEAGAASASHDVNNAYEPTEGFPIDENGQSVNDRDYERDKDAQRIVEQMAGAYDNRALQTPVIVSKDGVVLSGNNRTMSGDLAARQGTDKAYVDYLREFGAKYGFTPEQVQGMKNPRLVFVPDETLPYDATTFSRFNAQEMKSQSKPEAAVKLGKIVPDDVFNGIAGDIARYDRLSDYYGDEKAVAHALGALMQAGVINDKQMPEMRTGTALSAAGKELIENTLIGKVFQTSPDAVRQIISMPTLRQSIVMGLNEIAGNRTLAKQGYDLSNELGDAVDLVYRAKSAMPEVYTDGMPVSPFGRMQGLFDDEFGDSRVTDGATLLLADLLNSGKPSDIRKVLTSYNNEASSSANGQIDMSSGSIPTKEEILTNINEHFKNATPREQQALVDAAIAERKRRAEAEAEQRGGDQAGEQAADAIQRSAEPQQPSAGTESDLTPEEQAIAARVEVSEDDWTEGDENRPTYKRTIIIDGKHNAVQVDEPDADGHYTGSYFEYEGKRFGDIAEIVNHIDAPAAEPTEAQKKAGNYKMKHVRIDGYDISIENEKGSIRRGKDANGTEWESEIHNDYGYIRGTEGVDGDHIDVFLSDTPEQGDVFVVDQYNPDGSFDEHKVMYGFADGKAALDAYLANYEQGWEQTRRLDVTGVSKDEFKKWIQSSKRKTKPFAEYSAVRHTCPVCGKHGIQDYKSEGGICPQCGTDLDVFRMIDSLGNEQAKEVAQNLSSMEKQTGLYLPVGNGFFGKIYDQFKGKVTDAISFLTKAKEGDLLGVFKRKGFGDVDLVWGDVKGGWCHILDKHVGEGKSFASPEEAANAIDDIIRTGDKVFENGDKAVFEKDGKLVTVRKNLREKGKKIADKNWVLTAYDENSADGTTGATRATNQGQAAQTAELSDGKVNTLSSDKQESSTESSSQSEVAQPITKAYTITPSSYTNKAGKTTPMHSLQFTTPPTYEQRKALASFAREKTDGRKSRGWCSDKDTFSEWLFRTEEDARKAGDLIGNEEAVADAQPLSREDISKAVAPASKPKKAPINRVSVEDLAESLRQKGVAKLSDYAEPIEPIKPNEGERSLQISDEMKADEDVLRDLLGIDDEELGDVHFRDPGELTPEQKRKVYAVGVNYSLGYFDQGIVSFPDFAQAMVGRLGQKIKPWLKSFYEGAKRIPGSDEAMFTPTEDVDRFDVANFDKPSTDVLKQAEMIVEERKAREAAEQAEKDVIETRNQKRKESKTPSYPDASDKVAVSDWLFENGEVINEGIDAMSDDALADEHLLVAYRNGDQESREIDTYEYADRWIVDNLEGQPRFAKAYLDFGQRDLVASTIAGRIEDKLMSEVEADKASETVNGYMCGDKVLYNGKEATIVDFESDGRPVLDTGNAPIMVEVGHWDGIKPVDGIFGEAARVASEAKAKREAKYQDVGLTDADIDSSDLPRAAKERAKRALHGSSSMTDNFALIEVRKSLRKKKQAVRSLAPTEKPKKPNKSKKKDVTLNPEQPVGDLFSGLPDVKPTKNQNGERERNEDSRADNRGVEPGREELPSSEQVGAGTSVQDTAADSGSERRGLGIGGGESGTRPRYDVDRDYTNEEIHEIVSSVTTVKEGKVVITGEVTDDIKAVCRQYKSGGVEKKGRGVLDEYYTDGKIVDAVRMLITPYLRGKTGVRVLEPSVGTGNFADVWQGMPTSEIVAFEINETSARIAKILHPEMDVNLRPFETEFIDDSGNRKPLPVKYNLIVGNPPYGSHRGLYKGLGEESKIARYEDYFVKRSLDVLEDGGVLAMVLPSSWIDRHTRYGGYALEVAYRLPSGVFESTQVGTDIVVLRKDSGVPISEHSPYFESHPENICGEVRQRRGRFGKQEDYVEGSIDAAIESIERGNAKRLADELGMEPTIDNLNGIHSAIEETGDTDKAATIVREAKPVKRGNVAKATPSVRPAPGKGKYKLELRKGTEVIPTSSQFQHAFSDGEVEAFGDTNYDGVLDNPSRHSGYANYIGGKLVHDFYYAEGDIYGKLEQLEQDKESIVGTYGERQYRKQKELLESVLPKRKGIREIVISPNTTFVKNLRIHTPEGDVTLRDMFIEFCRKLPAQAFGSSSSWEVAGYVRNEQVYGQDKHRNQLVRERRKRVANDLFVKFLNEELSETERGQVVFAFNREYNSTYRPDYSKVPMFSTINKDFKGRPLKLTSVQLAGVGRMTVKGVGVLAHEVGFGKTLSGVLAMHEAMTRGFAKKPLIVVPNDNILEQWVETIGEALPHAVVNVLGNLGASYDLTGFRVNDFEFTIVTYEGLKAMSFSDDTYDRLSDRFSYITEDLKKHQSERDMQKAKEKRKELKGKMKRGTKPTYGFEDFGFDYLTFDEVHNANHIVSKVRLDKSVASDFRSQGQRTSDLGIKTWLAAQYIQEQNAGRNVLLLSATPFTNKPLEYYSILSLVGNDMLRRKGFFNVDQFFSTFMEADNELEIGANGRPVQKTNVRKFRNNGLFQQLLSEFIDIKGAEDNPDLERPERRNKEYRLRQNDLTAKAIAAAQDLLGDNDTVLQGIGHARAAAFSPYATPLSGLRPKGHKDFVENSPKIYATVKMIGQNRKDCPDAGQIVYSEVGVEFFPLIRDYLVEEVGFEPEEVRIITGATSNAERVNIQTAFNKGEVKVVIGSPAIKEGLNLQENTTDMYILSLPWNFTQLRQIEGRGWRQGNRWNNIRINYMLTDDSVDVFMLQRLQTKQDLYNEAMKRGAESVDVSDIDTAELKTALITDPAVRAEIVTMQERAKLDQERMRIEADLAFVMRKYKTYNELVEDADSQRSLIERYGGYAEKGGGYWEGLVKSAQRKLVSAEQEIEHEKQRLLEKGINVDDIEHQAGQSKDAIKAIEEKIEQLKEFEQELTEKYRQESQAKDVGDSLSSYLSERKKENQGDFYTTRQKKGESSISANGDAAKFRDGESDGERLLAIRGLEPIEVASNSLNKAELQEVYRNLPSVEKDGREIEFYHSAFKKIYKKGGLFGQIVPVLDQVLEQSVLAYSEKDNRGGEVRPDGSVHKYHPNVTTFDNYVGKVVIGGKEFYVRTTVENGVGQAGTHSFFVSGVEIYEKTADGLSVPNFPSGESDHQRLDDPAGETTSTEIPRVKSAADGIVDAKLRQFFERASVELLPHDMRQRAMGLSEKLHTPIRLVDSADEAMENPSARHRRAKGWATDTGEIVVIVPNHSDVADIENTVVHEIVGHDGLEAMIGPERMDEFVTEVYGHAAQGIKKKIDARADKEYYDDIDRMTRQKGGGVFARAEATVEANARKRAGHYQREATKEYMADMAGEIGDKGFERMSQEEQTLWGKIKAKVQQFLDKFLRGLKIAKSIRLTDKDLAYILYKAWKHKRENGVFAKAEDIVMRRKTGWDKLMFADGGNKKTGISEAGLNPIYPSEAGQKSGSEVRLNAITNPATNHTAKVMEKLEIAKAGLYQVAEAYRDTNNPKRFLTDLSRSMDLIVGQGGSGYRSFELKDGRVMTIRVSNHNANSEYAKEPTVSIVVKRRQTPNTFRTSEKSEVHEYVYFRDELQKAPAGTLSSIAESISELLDTGEYIDRTGLARENHSPETKKAVSQRVLSLMKSEHLTSVTDGASLSGAKLPKFFEYPKSESEPRYRFRDGGLGQEDERDSSRDEIDFSDETPAVVSTHEEFQAVIDQEHRYVRNAARTNIIRDAEDFAGMLRRLGYSEGDIGNEVERYDQLVASKTPLVGGYDPVSKEIIIFAKSSMSAGELKSTVQHEELHHAIDIDPALAGAVKELAPYIRQRHPAKSAQIDRLYADKPAAERDEEIVAYFIEGAINGHALQWEYDNLPEKYQLPFVTLTEAIGYGKRPTEAEEWPIVTAGIKLNRTPKDAGVSEAGAHRENNGQGALRPGRGGGDIQTRDGYSAPVYGRDAQTRAESEVTAARQGEETGRRSSLPSRLKGRVATASDEKFSSRDRAMARKEYEDRVGSGGFQFQEAMQDSMLGLEALYKSVLGEDTNIKDVPGFENAYLAENRMSSMNASGQHEYAVRYMQPLVNAMRKITGSSNTERRALTDYLMAKHGLERNEHMRKEAAAKNENADRDFAGLTALTGEENWRDAEAAARKMVEDYEEMYDTVELWKAINAATGASLETVYKGGLLSKENYERIRDMYSHYVPLRGWDETTSDEVYGYLTSRDGAVPGNVVKKARGRRSKADDPIATIAMMADAAIRQANRNVMKQRFLNFVMNHPSDVASVNGLWLKRDDVSHEWKPVFADLLPTDTPEMVERKVAEFNERMKALGKSKPKRYKHGRKAKDLPYKVVDGHMGEHNVLVKRNGQTYVVTINGNPRAAQALNGLTNPDTNVNGVYDFLAGIGTRINRWLSAGYTTLNPEFVASNFLRDLFYAGSMVWVKENKQYGMRFLKNLAVANPFRVGKLLRKWTKGTLGGSEQELQFYAFMANGGETGYTLVRDIESHKKTIAAELKKRRNVLRNGLRWAGEWYGIVNRAAENAARFAAFLTSREMGRGIDRAIYDAKEITVNFNKKGAGGKMFGKNGQTAVGNLGAFISWAGRGLYPFWNAGIQGLDNNARYALFQTGKYVTRGTALFALGFFTPIANWIMISLFGDDDDDPDAYYNLPEHTRRSNICLWLGGDRWATIPLPVEDRSIYGLGELAYGVASGNERYGDWELAFQIGSQVSQLLPLDMLEGGGGISPFIPGWAKPVVEPYVLNRSWTGLPISKDGEWYEHKPEWEKAYSNTNPYLVKASRWLNEVSGGTYGSDYKKGLIDINPAKLEYMLRGVLGGRYSFPSKFVNMAGTVAGDREFRWQDVPMAGRLLKSGDERMDYRKLQKEYRKFEEEYEETGQIVKGFQNEVDNGIFRYAEKLAFLNNSPEYLRYEIFDYFKADIDAYEEAINQEADKARHRELEEEFYVLKLRVVEALRNPEQFVRELSGQGLDLPEYGETKRREQNIRKLKSGDEALYKERREEFAASPEYGRYKVVNNHKRTIRNVRKEQLGAKTPQERARYNDSIEGLNQRMYERLRDMKQ